MTSRICIFVISLLAGLNLAQAAVSPAKSLPLTFGKTKIASCHSDKSENGIRIQYWLEIYAEKLQKNAAVGGAVDTLVEITNARKQTDRDTEPTLKATVTMENNRLVVDTLSGDEKLNIPLNAKHTLVSNRHKDNLHCSILSNEVRVNKVAKANRI